MRKLHLAIEDLAVESFTTGRGAPWAGTVEARELNTGDECDTQWVTVCVATCDNPCTTDGNATIDAVLCAQSIGTICGTDQTLRATTCRNTGICCGGPTLNRTFFCCQG